MDFPSAPRDIPYSGSGSLMLVSECFGLDAVEVVEYLFEGISEKVELPCRLGYARNESCGFENRWVKPVGGFRFSLVDFKVDDKD